MDVKHQSAITGEWYYSKEAVRILNIYQAIGYLIHGVKLIDLYPSKDKKTGKPILVFVFDKFESREAYDLWCKHLLKTSPDDVEE